MVKCGGVSVTGGVSVVESGGVSVTGWVKYGGVECAWRGECMVG